MTDRRWNRTLVPMMAVLSLAACGSDSATGPEDIDFVNALDIDLDEMTRTASGLYIQDLTVGDGAIVEAGDIVVMDYAGWLPNGALFDSGTDAVCHGAIHGGPGS